MTKEISQETIKNNIKIKMNDKHIGIVLLSKITRINIFILVFLLYTPFKKVKLSEGIKICKALKIEVSAVVV